MACPIYDFRFQDEEELDVELQVEPPPTKKAQFVSVDKSAMDQLDHNREPRGTRQTTDKWFLTTLTGSLLSRTGPPILASSLLSRTGSLKTQRLVCWEREKIGTGECCRVTRVQF